MAVDLRGASAEAYGSLEDRLEGLSGDDAAAVGSDLLAIAGVLRTEAALRRVVTDPSLAAKAKAGLVREVFGSGAGAGAVDLAAEAATLRWTRTRDLADALESLGIVALVRSAGDEADRVADELFEFAQAVHAHPELRDALSDPGRSLADKQDLVRGLLEGKAHPATVRLAVQALSGSHRTVTLALESYQQVAAEAHGQRVATVRAARPLSEETATRLREALTRQYDREVHLNVVVDPDVVGGLRVEIGDDVIDGTVATRLADARRRLAG